MARLSGLSQDTLRWYEKEGLLPPVPRSTDGRRRYRAQDRSMVQLLAALRRTGMPTGEMKRFVGLLTEGAASHGRRITVLQAHLERLHERRRLIDDAEARLTAKIDHYEELISRGLDCTGDPVPEDQRATQATRG
ncbi:MerR family transcriptional regulator [Actinomyces bowdenii]|uniref:MerR family transcriptional regulator n=2 Tax=Actinomyces bowdenii TaxID=131109 RepID=A0A853EK89_9ACTO|nr:MerR family transcriptional regulator [Actinomyces bowdenii]NYS68471.1 MerR family transcriptional regulator [Actinomyces bowdenii]